MNLGGLLADIVLIIHFLFVLFVVGSLPLIWIGARMRLRLVRNRRFRFAHLAAILYVAAESLIGMICPLTWLEDTLRNRPTGAGFIERWLHRILFYEIPEWIFPIVYVLFALLVIITFRLVPPRPRKPHP
ncbi:DUF2784 domain-containing protein [Nitrosovibrio sp. Nv6]|uniref:DUF2784 domain-containing protein n=1 Tax=Nitrosovibrio sp. Nv6 TaxID=1855340 RepID=UPI0008BF98D5|nr:DUF2784 domain-containing protein [Nitrosovibrio sp. Nv6]SEP41145.1 Protein of Unknown function [Nitrosovibrio sp. Nv6]